MEVVASLSQGRTAAAQCGLFTHESVPVIFEPPCTCGILSSRHTVQGRSPKILYTLARCNCRVTWGAEVNLLNPAGCVNQQV